MIRQAKEKYGDSSINPLFLVGTAEKLPFVDDSFDLIIAIGFIEYFEDPYIPMREIVRVLKPEGTLIIQSFKLDIYQKLSKIFGLTLMMQLAKYIYRKLFGLSPHRPHVDIPYSKDKLDGLMETAGFRKVSYLYNNFNVFPKIIRRLFPGAYINLSEKITHWKPDRFGIFAINYIGRYILCGKKPF